MASKDSLGDRMKGYENVPRTYLTSRMPLIIRVDGCHFHTYTRGLEKPFDPGMHQAMTDTATALIKSISGARLAYIQSDEISVLVNDWEMFDTQPWFDKNLQKVVSVSASIATAAFNNYMVKEAGSKKLATFDSRAFVIPREEVRNYFLWRQQDAVRNGIQGLAQKHYSQKQLFKKNQTEMISMLAEKGVIRGTLPTWQKMGWCVVRANAGILTDLEIPDFKFNAQYIQDHLIQVEE